MSENMSSILILLMLGFAGIGMFSVGLRGLVKQKVTIYSGKWLVALIAVCFFPNFLKSFQIVAKVPVIGMISLLMYPMLIWVFWRSANGYIVFGVSEAAITEALKTVLDQLNLKFEQRLASIQLEDGSVFQVAVHEWVGTAQLKPKNAAAKAHIGALVSNLSDYFSKSEQKIKTFTYWTYSIFGGLLTLMLLVILAGVFLKSATA